MGHYYPQIHSSETKERVIDLIKNSKMTIEEMVKETYVSKNTICSWACEQGLSLRGRCAAVQERRKAKDDSRNIRDTDMIEKLLSNVKYYTTGTIASEYGITRERVRQILMERGAIKIYKSLK